MAIAVVGCGIAGLAAARSLARRVDVELFDAGAEPGGHVRTVVADGVALDTGFIVHNVRNYPRLSELLVELGLRTQAAEMSFSVECACGVAWSSRAPWQAGPGLLHEILRFLRAAARDDAGDRTLAQYLQDEGYSRSFAWHYAGPMTAALWSTAPGQALEAPAAFVIDFFRTHGLLGARRHRWRTIVGGSAGYVRRLLEQLDVPVRCGVPVREIRRDAHAVGVTTADGVTRSYDAVVLATHPPQALALLADPSDAERRILGSFTTTRNEVVLHTDARMLPTRTRRRAAWNYHSDCRGVTAPPATVTYSLNRLQRLSGSREYCVTLNRSDEIDASLVLRTYEDHHPRVTFASIGAQAELPALNGVRRTAFAGAWQGYGFHEDGVRAGERAAEALLA